VLLVVPELEHNGSVPMGVMELGKTVTTDPAEVVKLTVIVVWLAVPPGTIAVADELVAEVTTPGEELATEVGAS